MIKTYNSNYYRNILTLIYLCLLRGNNGESLLPTTSLTPPTLDLEIWPRTEDGVINYNSAEKDNYTKYLDDLDELLKEYIPDEGTSSVHQLYCSYDQPASSNSSCVIETNLSQCIKENQFSYHKNSPCIFLKLKPSLGWNPTPFKDLKDLPDGMPTDLRKIIEETLKKDENALKKIWISCEGDQPADVEYVGPIEYFPSASVPNYYFPRSEAAYSYPLIALHFQSPKVGVPISVTCIAWARDLVATTSFHIILN